jgi:small subunit ribosomal protein S10
LSPAQLAHLKELVEACETDEELQELFSSPDLSHLLALQQSQDLADMPEPFISFLPIPGRGLYPPVYHEPQWRIPVATITFRGYDTERLALFTHFAIHVASALGIPTSKVYPLPKRRRLWTVLRSPFVHKKSQENFERITHSRGVKAWDAHPDVVNLWTQMLMSHAMAGVGMRIVRWTRMELGGGASELKKVKEKLRDLYKQTNEKVGDSERVRRVGEKIVETELAAVEQASVEASAGVEKTADAP